MSVLVSFCALILARSGSLASSTFPASNSSHTLYIIAMAPYPDPLPDLDPSWDGGASLIPAARLAVLEINNRSDVLGGFRLELLEEDSGCQITSKAVIGFVKNVLPPAAAGVAAGSFGANTNASTSSPRQVVGVVGPGCSGAAVAVASLANRPTVKTIQASCLLVCLQGLVDMPTALLIYYSLVSIAEKHSII